MVEPQIYFREENLVEGAIVGKVTAWLLSICSAVLFLVSIIDISMKSEKFKLWQDLKDFYWLYGDPKMFCEDPKFSFRPQKVKFSTHEPLSEMKIDFVNLWSDFWAGKSLCDRRWTLTSSWSFFVFFFCVNKSEQFNWINLNKRSVMEGTMKQEEAKTTHRNAFFASFIFMPFTSHFRSNFDRFCHHFRFLFFTLENRNARIDRKKFPPTNLHKFGVFCFFAALSASQKRNHRRVKKKRSKAHLKWLGDLLTN